MFIEWTPLRVTIFWIVVEVLMLSGVAFGFYAVIHQATNMPLIDIPQQNGTNGTNGTNKMDKEDEQKDIAIDVESLINIQRQARIFAIIALSLYAFAFILESIVARALQIPSS